MWGCVGCVGMCWMGGLLDVLNRGLVLDGRDRYEVLGGRG